jgi:WD40 repeat protein
VKSGKKLVKFKGHEDALFRNEELCQKWYEGDFNGYTTYHGVLCVAWSPDSKLVASGGIGRSVMVWDAATGKQQLEPLYHDGSVTCVAFGSNTKLLVTATAGTEPAILIWDLGQGARAILRHTLKGHTADLTRISLSPDNTTIVSSSFSRDMRLWSIPNGREMRVLQKSSCTGDAMFSPDGQYIVGCVGPCIRMWKINAQVSAHGAF